MILHVQYVSMPVLCLYLQRASKYCFYRRRFAASNFHKTQIKVFFSIAKIYIALWCFFPFYLRENLIILIGCKKYLYSFSTVLHLDAHRIALIVYRCANIISDIFRKWHVCFFFFFDNILLCKYFLINAIKISRGTQHETTRSECH